MNLLSIIDKINNISDRIRDFIVAHQYQGFLWVGLFGIGIVVFIIAYNALNKD